MKPNFYNRIKGSKESKEKKSYTNIKNFVFFDCETFEYFENEDQEDPFIVPYLIGFVDSETKQFNYFIGINSSIKFITWLLGDKRHKGKTLSDIYSNKWTFKKNQRNEEKRWKEELTPLNDKCNLVAFNIAYDYHSCRPWWENFYGKDLEMDYKMSEDRDFIVGELKTSNLNIFKNKSYIRFIDLWMWDRTLTLDKSIQKVRSIIWKDGKVKNESESIDLYEESKLYGLKERDFQKGKLGHYKKINLHKKGSDYYFWTSKEAWIKKEEPIKLDLESELDYLKTDVMLMPIVYKQQEVSKKLMMNMVGITKPVDTDSSITVPGFAKYLFEEFVGEYMQQSFRCKVSKNDYLNMVSSYSGAFTSSNKDILYIDEHTFKELYPDKNFYDDKGNPIIKCYDVNSMYPYIMSGGIPKLIPSIYKRKLKECVVWYEVAFLNYIDKKNKILYKWKDKYDCFNNAFFGNSFVESPSTFETKVYILDKLYDLFTSMCDAKTKVVAKRYQPIEKPLLEKFIYKLYNIKENKENKYTQLQVSECKLLMNSLYGKFGERFRNNSITWTTDINKYIEDLINKLDPVDNKADIDKLIKKQVLYKNKDNMGFIKVPNLNKTYDEWGTEVRESILSGCYVTQMARYILLSAIKNEIDQGNVFLNCDTDSFKLLEFKPVKFEIDKSKLGSWKYEGCFTHFGHPNKLKKYWLANTITKEIKIASAGIPKKALLNEDIYTAEEAVKTLRTIFDSKNRILIKEAKNVCRWSKSIHQPIIRQVNIDMIGEKEKEPYTHQIINGIITEICH